MTKQPPATLTALHAAYRDGSWRPSDVVEHWLARPSTVRSAPVWISTVAATALRLRAAQLDVELARDPEPALAQPTFGALYAVKDNIDVNGMPTTAACPAFGRYPGQSANVVQALEAGGAIMVGKTNLDQFATGLVGTRSPYGAVPNALNPALISGGSSSGSAVAVASGLVHFALGTDTAGSGRVPAALNNIVGWKPTLGFLSTTGVVPACRSLDCVSIFALTVPDAARVFAVTATPRDALDHPRLAHGFRFAIPQREQCEFYGDLSAAAGYAAAIERLRTLGGTPVEIDFAPWREVAAMLYEGAHVAERHAGIHSFFDAQSADMDSTVRGIIANGLAYSASDVFIASARLDQLRAALAPLWNTFDVMVVPTAPTTYAIAQVQADPVETNRRMGTYTNFVNFLDLAAMAVPASIRDDGIPFGITLVGPAGSDLMLADLGQRIHADAGLTLGATGLPMPAPEALRAQAGVARIAVVGAHLAGLPLNPQLTDRGGKLVRRTRTAPCYQLYALPGTAPPKPGMVRIAGVGTSLEVEIWELSLAAFGAFVLGVPSPLAIGTVLLEDDSSVHGFLCEAAAVAGAEDISRFGGWRNYLEALASKREGRPVTPA